MFVMSNYSNLDIWIWGYILYHRNPDLSIGDLGYLAWGARPLCPKGKADAYLFYRSG